MGYDQELSLTFSKAAHRKDEARAFFALTSRRLREIFECDRFDSYQEEFKKRKATVGIFIYGRHLYDSGNEGPSWLGSGMYPTLKLSRELSCRIEVEYRGEESGDIDHNVVENGEVTHVYQLVEVDLRANIFEAFSELERRLRGKGLAEEAKALKDLGAKIAARYLFA